MIWGNVFDIMRYSIHDGPGIRTTVFLKGCLMHCWWCHNPESQAPAAELIIRPERCIGCGECISSCPQGLITEDGSFDKDNCLLCGKCSDVCHAGAREMVGRKMSTAEVLAEIEKDAMFYEQSGGGVTFSGGEPLLQPDFLCSLLEGCREREIHTAVETAGFVRSADLLKVGVSTDLFLYDVKLIDEAKHKEYTGVSNRLILDNLQKLASKKRANIIIRVPIIPGVNDDEDNIVKTGELAASLGIAGVNILPYHKTGIEKHKRLGRAYLLSGVEPPTIEYMKKIAKRIETLGLRVKIGG